MTYTGPFTMQQVSGVTADGASHKFNVIGHYYSPTEIRKKVCESKTAKAAVSYTTVSYDRGSLYDDVGREYKYDNGFCGNQDISYYDSLKEAKEEFEKKLQLTPKAGVSYYCNIWIIKK